MSKLVTFVRHRRAIAAMEFGLALPFLVLVLAGAADFGFAQWRRSALTNAVSQGAFYAFLTGPTVTAAKIQTMVDNAASITGVSASANAPACYCITATATPATLTSATCNSACSDGTTAVKYVAITGSYTLSSFFPATSPYNHLNNAGTADTVSDTVTVRLQ
jgi:Flp pilus assembly protein TadG